jgi:hypothetical protein
MILINGCSFTASHNDYDSWAVHFSNKIKDFNNIRNVSSGGASNLSLIHI